MDNNAQFWIFLTTSVSSLLGIFAVYVKQKSDRIQQKEDAKSKDEQLTVIHEAVNSNLDKVNLRLDASMKEIHELRAIISGLIKSANGGEDGMKQFAQSKLIQAELDSAQGLLKDKPVVIESVPVVLEAKVEIGELETHESGDVKLKKVEKPK